MISMGIHNVAKFDFLEPPPQDAIEGAIRQLILLGAIECVDESRDTETKEIGTTFNLTGKVKGQ